MTDPVAAAEAAIAADARHADPAMWILRLPDATIRAAAREVPDGPLRGLTFAVKDNIDIAGLPTTAGCPGYAYTPTESAPVVQRLLAAGALLIGKTNLDQFATGLVGVRSPYGVPRNVFDSSRVPGGSSSGSAVAVAAGIVDVSLGTDTAGSGRVPAMFGNIIGMKPTIGSIPGTGVVPACRSIDTVSVFAASVDQALAVLRVAAGFDAADPYSRAAPFAHLRRAGRPRHARMACIDPTGCDPAQDAAYRDAAAHFDATIIDIAPFLAIARLLYDGPWVAERTAALREVIEQRAEIVHPTTRAILQGGLHRLTVDAFTAFHQLARTKRMAEALFREFDALLLPTAPNTPTLTELQADPIGPNSRLGTYTNFVNLCDLAAIAVPAGVRDGLPTGVTLVGPAWSEGRLAPLADELHRATTGTVGGIGTLLPAAELPDALAPDEIALFCIGAHMAGLPLNARLTTRGGRFVREAETRPAYRLHHLGNRPGMVRDERGGSVAGEVWALPAAAIGPLLAEIPPPLGFGTVELTDGPCLGFVAEAAGVAGTPDITALRSWRAA